MATKSLLPLRITILVFLSKFTWTTVARHEIWTQFINCFRYCTMIITIKSQTMLSLSPQPSSTNPPRRWLCDTLEHPLNKSSCTTLPLKRRKAKDNPFPALVALELELTLPFTWIRFYYFKRIANPFTITVSISSFTLSLIRPKYNSTHKQTDRQSQRQTWIPFISISIFICLSARLTIVCRLTYLNNRSEGDNLLTTKHSHPKESTHQPNSFCPLSPPKRVSTFSGKTIRNA